MASTAEWDDRRADHRRAIAAFAGRARQVDERAWTRQPVAGKWSPGQVTEHLVLSYEAALRELQGGLAPRVRTKWWQRPLIRFRYLKMILDEGRMPAGAKAVREVRPPESPRGRDIVVEDFQRLGARFDEELSRAHAAGRGHLTHPIFGRLEAHDALRCVTVHIDHHRKQLPGTP